MKTHIIALLITMSLYDIVRAEPNNTVSAQPVISAIDNHSDFIIHCITITKRANKGIYETCGLIIKPGARAMNLNLLIERDKPVLFTIIDGKSRPIVLYNNGTMPNIIETVCIKNGEKRDPLYISLDEWSQQLQVSISNNLEIFFSPWDKETV